MFIFPSAVLVYFLFLLLFPLLACFENAGQHMLSQSLQNQQKKVQERQWEKQLNNVANFKMKISYTGPFIEPTNVL